MTSRGKAIAEVAVIVAFLLVVGYLLVRWWMGADPESEVREALRTYGLGEVEVHDCRWSEDPSDDSPVYDAFACELSSPEAVALRVELRSSTQPSHVWTLQIDAGKSFHCFSIPRAVDPIVRIDVPPDYWYEVPRRSTSCFDER